MFEVEDHGDSLAGDLVRIVGRRTVDAVKSVALMAIIAFWVAVVIRLVQAF